MRGTWTRLLLEATALVVASGLVVGIACGSDDNGDGDGGVVDGAGTAVSGGHTPGAGGGNQTPDGGGTGTPAAGTSTAGSGGQTLQVEATNSQSFSTDELDATAGTITVELANKEDGAIHSIAFYESAEAEGSPIALTEVTVGPATESVAFNVKPGEYYFNCQPHPEMHGTLKVEN